MWTLARHDVIWAAGDADGTVTSKADHALEEAIAWHLRLDEAGADEWRRFVAWLEADAAHRDAYDRLTLEDDATPMPAMLPATTPARAPRRWPRRIAWTVPVAAAAAAVWVALLSGHVARSDPYSIETGPGMRHVIALADGTRIEMNGDTRVTIDRTQPRVARLDRGEAMFDVVHHPDRPFEVHAGSVVLRDVGTRFDVVRSGPSLDVAVAEGSVLFQPGREAVPLTRGMALAMREGDDHVTLSHVDPDAVGGWREGQLDFREVPLAQVAAGITRSTGVALRIDPAMAARPFTGTLRTDRPGAEVVRSLAALVAGEARQDGPGWRIVPKAAGAH